MHVVELSVMVQMALARQLSQQNQGLPLQRLTPEQMAQVQQQIHQVPNQFGAAPQVPPPLPTHTITDHHISHPSL